MCWTQQVARKNGANGRSIIQRVEAFWFPCLTTTKPLLCHLFCTYYDSQRSTVVELGALYSKSSSVCVCLCLFFKYRDKYRRGLVTKVLSYSDILVSLKNGQYQKKLTQYSDKCLTAFDSEQLTQCVCVWSAAEQWHQCSRQRIKAERRNHIRKKKQNKKHFPHMTHGRSRGHLNSCDCRNTYRRGLRSARPRSQLPCFTQGREGKKRFRTVRI